MSYHTSDIVKCIIRWSAVVLVALILRGCHLK